jgi:putative phosphotransacetylase
MPTGTAIDSARVQRLVAEIAGGQARPSARPSVRGSRLVVNTSARHMHVSPEHLRILFGPDAELTPMRRLYQTGQFASEQTVDLIGPRRRLLKGLRILGPVRPATQIELAFSDAINLGIDAPVRMSGDTAGTPGAIVLGPAGHVELGEGIIRARRHVHMALDDAREYGVNHGDALDLVVEHPTCPIVLEQVMVRVHADFKLEVHIDTDEGNACDLSHATAVRLRKASRPVAGVST